MTDKNLPSPELLRKLLRYEPDTGKLYWRERDECRKEWNTRFANKEAFFTEGARGYNQGCINGVRFYAHRVIWAMSCGKWPAEQIDHINGIRTDNRLENLRPVSKSENAKNQKRSRSNTSGVTGVYLHKKANKWMAYISSGANRKYLGIFSSIEDAIAARKDAEVKLGFHPNHGRQL